MNPLTSLAIILVVTVIHLNCQVVPSPEYAIKHPESGMKCLEIFALRRPVRLTSCRYSVTGRLSKRQRFSTPEQRNNTETFSIRSLSPTRNNTCLYTGRNYTLPLTNTWCNSTRIPQQAFSFNYIAIPNAEPWILLQQVEPEMCLVPDSRNITLAECDATDSQQHWILDPTTRIIFQ